VRRMHGRVRRPAAPQQRGRWRRDSATTGPAGRARTRISRRGVNPCATPAVILPRGARDVALHALAKRSTPPRLTGKCQPRDDLAPLAITAGISHIRHQRSPPSTCGGTFGWTRAHAQRHDASIQHVHRGDTGCSSCGGSSFGSQQSAHDLAAWSRDARVRK
jgi:hypothetical protein